MNDEFYLGLTDEQIKICEILIKRAREWGLAIKKKSGFLGFGKRREFYLFWVSWSKETPYFKARLVYDYEQPQELPQVALLTENLDKILADAEQIYKKYSASYVAESEVPKRVSHPANKGIVRTPPMDPAYPWDTVAEAAVAAFAEAEAAGALTIDEHAALAGEVLGAKAENILLILCEMVSTVRTRDIWLRYMLSDKETLATVAVDYGITRERIRQIVEKGKITLSKIFKKACRKGGESALTVCLAEMRNLLEKEGANALFAFYRGFTTEEKRKRSFLTQLLFGADFEETVAAISESYDQVLSEKKKDDRLLQKLADIQKKICYPSQIFTDAQVKITSFPTDKKHALTDTFKRKLEKLQGYVTFVQNPNIVYYNSFKTSHRPDFMLQFTDGKRVLVVLLNTINMAFWYNRRRLTELHRFCEINGYGYLVLDGNGRSFEEIISTPIDNKLCTELDNILHINGQIVWQDIRELKGRYSISNIQIAAYVLQRNLNFALEPHFCIRRFS